MNEPFWRELVVNYHHNINSVRSFERKMICFRRQVLNKFTKKKQYINQFSAVHKYCLFLTSGFEI